MQEFVGSCLRAVCTIRGIRGTVKGSDTRSETSVSGSVTGGGAYGNSGYQQSVGGQISSHTTRFQNVFLTDAEGQDLDGEIIG